MRFISAFNATYRIINGRYVAEIKSCPKEARDIDLCRLTLCYLLTASNPNHMVLETLGKVEAVGAGEDAIKEVIGTEIKSLSAAKMGYTTRDVGDLVVGYIQT